MDALRLEMHIAGISPTESWEYTWGEGLEAVQAYREREQRRGKRQAVALYNAAAFLLGGLSASISGGSLPSFREAFPGYGDAQIQSNTMSDAELYAQARALNAMFGGREE